MVVVVVVIVVVVVVVVVVLFQRFDDTKLRYNLRTSMSRELNRQTMI